MEKERNIIFHDTIHTKCIVLLEMEQLKIVDSISKRCNPHQWMLYYLMVTNVAKTEVMIFSRKPIDTVPLSVKNSIIIPPKNMKVLGVKFSSEPTWDCHINGLIKKARFVIKKLRFLSRFININSMKRIVTSHFFSLLYYAAPVWMTE